MPGCASVPTVKNFTESRALGIQISPIVLLAPLRAWWHEERCECASELVHSYQVVAYAREEWRTNRNGFLPFLFDARYVYDFLTSCGCHCQVRPGLSNITPTTSGAKGRCGRRRSRIGSTSIARADNVPVTQRAFKLVLITLSLLRFRRASLRCTCLRVLSSRKFK